jgi:hemolysin III
MSSVALPQVKPRLRGVSHAVGALLALPVVTVCVALASPGRPTLAAAIHGASVLFLLTASAVYHTPNWSPKVRLWLKRIDHTAIFALIAGTYTPLCLIALGDQGFGLLTLLWGIALGGALQTLLWPSAPRWVKVPLYLIMGWLPMIYISEIVAAIGAGLLILVLLGGVLYTLGALAYARRWPDPIPETFGYHEIFHLCVLSALVYHYFVVWALVVA